MRKTVIAGLLVIASCFGLAAHRTHAPRYKWTREALPASGQGFAPSCASPSFPAVATDIDGRCGLDGSGSGAEARQNDAKNNFCASGTPQPVTLDQLLNLQNRADNNRGINFGDQNTATRRKGPTTNRAPLQQMGEGNLVVFRGYVLNARQEGPESVNCGRNVPNQPAFHDIHISLADQPGAHECSGFVAEMIPHHRPDAWTAENVLKLKTAGALVRVTGQLMFDSSHVPCDAGSRIRSNPSRASLWEIHPIYKFEVCAADCQGAGKWVDLAQWAKNE